MRTLTCPDCHQEYPAEERGVFAEALALATHRISFCRAEPETPPEAPPSPGDPFPPR